MQKGGMLLVTAAVLACTACLGGGKLEVRSVSGGLKAGPEPVPFRIAEARSHLALGNVGLALEGFRKAAREDPASIEALAGIADCYDRMGRFDLSRRHYERALALAPNSQGLLAAFAASLDLQGKTVEASSVRRELAALAQPQPVIAPQIAPAPAAPAPVAEAVAVAAIEPAPAPITAPAPVGQSVTIALPPPRPADVPKAKPVAPQAMAVAPVGRSVTIALPPPRPARAAAASSLPPRLERLSLTEVALITGSGPRWKRQPAQVVRSADVRLLNAARVDKLAARTRAYLGQFGWRQIMIGDAASVRSRSLILYPEGSRAAASRLSVRFGFAMAPRKDVRQLTVLLGRDAATHPALQPKA